MILRRYFCARKVFGVERLQIFHLSAETSSRTSQPSEENGWIQSLTTAYDNKGRCRQQRLFWHITAFSEVYTSKPYFRNDEFTIPAKELKLGTLKFNALLVTVVELL